MIIGIPKEIKTLEGRVALTPAGAIALKQEGHAVLVERDAGINAGISNEAYEKAGAELAECDEIWMRATLIVKVKEPLPIEWSRIKSHHIIFTYFHLAADPLLTRFLADSGATCIAYETVQLPDKTLPLLQPMSEIAGRMATQVGVRFLEKPQGGKGKLPGGIPGVPAAQVLILGAGVVGMQAAKMAAGLGAKVCLMDISLPRLRQLADTMPANVELIYCTREAILSRLPKADLIIGAVLIPGKRAPILIQEEDLNLMEKGSVIVDVAVDQGGCIETCKPTTHDNPVYVVNGILHYGVANMPGAVPITSTLGLTQATLPYILNMAALGMEGIMDTLAVKQGGLNVRNGKVWL